MFPEGSGLVLCAVLGLVYLVLIYLATQTPDLEADDPNAEVVELPDVAKIYKSGLYYLLPIIVLVYFLMIERKSPGLSAFWATFLLFFILLTQKSLKAMFRGESNPIGRLYEGFIDLIEGMIDGARNMIGIGLATATAGIIVGTVSLTGIGQVMAEFVEFLSGGNLLAMLFFVAVISIILGMGLPTTANYIVVSSLMAPVIMELGAQAGLIVPLVAVHMFVFYFGIMADVTPPVGLASFAAAAISGADPLKTGFTAFFYSLRTAVLPFLFIFNTDLLLIDVGPVKAVFVFFISLIAMLVFAAVTQGYFIAKTKKWEAIVMMLIVFMLFRPDFFLDQWQDKYTETSGPAALTALEELPTGSTARLRISAPDFDTGIVGTTTVTLTPEADGSGAERLDAVGLTVFEDGDMLVLDEPFPGTPYFDQLANDYDFYGDEPAQIEAIEIENDRMAKEIFFIPALLLLLMIVAIQRPRATQPAF